MSENHSHIICGSEDGDVYIWNTINDYVPTINPKFTGFKKDRNASIESFSPFEQLKVASTQAKFCPLAMLVDWKYKFSGKTITDIIVVSSIDGIIRVFLNEFNPQQ